MAQSDWNGDTFVWNNSKGTVTFTRDDCKQDAEFFLRYGAKVWFSRYLAKASNGSDADYYAMAMEAKDRLLEGGLGSRKGGSVEALMERAYQLLAQLHNYKPAQAKAWYDEYLTFDDERKAKVRDPKNGKSGAAMAKAIEQARTEKALKNAATVESDEPFNPNAD